MAEAREEIVIEAPLDAVYGVIVDYARYPEFLPETQTVQVLERDEHSATVRFEVEMLMRVEYTLRLEETPKSLVNWTLVDARMLSENRGGWELEALDEQRTKAVYRVEVDFARALPSSVSHRLAGKALPKTLQRFKERVESLHQASA